MGVIVILALAIVALVRPSPLAASLWIAATLLILTISLIGVASRPGPRAGLSGRASPSPARLALIRPLCPVVPDGA